MELLQVWDSQDPQVPAKAQSVMNDQETTEMLKAAKVATACKCGHRFSENDHRDTDHPQPIAGSKKPTRHPPEPWGIVDAVVIAVCLGFLFAGLWVSGVLG